MSPSLLTVTDLHTYYGDSHVLQGVSLQVARGAVVAVLGRNGVGKTTLCRSLVGFTPARAGRVAFDGTDITASAPHEIHRRGLAMVPQGRRIFPSLTVRENLLIAKRPSGAGPHTSGAEDGSREPEGWSLDRVYSLFPRLGERSHHGGHELSGGEQQMLAIARALVSNPILLVMDEPTEGLAPSLVAEVGNVIGRVKAGGTSVLLVEQNAAFAVGVAHHVHIMSQGRLVHDRAPAALWENEDIKTRFLGVPTRTG